MKNIKIFLLFISLLSLPLIYGISGCRITASTPELFEQAWTDFDQNYSYFTYKNIDWGAIKTQYAPDFEQQLSAEDFAQQLNEMLQVLHDWHIWVQAPNGDISGYNGSYSINRPDTSITDPYIQELDELAKNVIYHGIVGNNIAYIEIDTLDTEAFKAVSDQAMEDMFAKYANADAMIIDIRFNSGGNEENAVKIASRFTDEAFMYGYTVNRNGENHDDFDEPYEHSLEPATGTHFTGPAVCLIGKKCMSSAEWFTLMMKHIPNITLIGDTTRGASGFPRDFKLSNGVSYGVPRWVAYTYYDEVIEDRGIAPDVAINNETVTTTMPGDGATTTMPGGGLTTTSLPGGGSATTTVPGTNTTTSVNFMPTTTSTVAVNTGGKPVIDSFTAAPASGDFNTTFVLTCKAHPGSEGNMISYYYWDFDGNKNTAEDFREIGIYYLYDPYGYYLKPGKNTINVMVEDDMGNESDIMSLTITIEE